MTRTKWNALALTALLAGLAGLATPAHAAKSTRTRSKTRVTGKVNLNTASPKQLRLLPRVGKKTAQAIVAYRAKNRFQSVREIMQVKGIGKKSFLKLKPYLTLKGANTIQRHKPRRKRRARRAGKPRRKNRYRCR